MTEIFLKTGSFLLIILMGYLFKRVGVLKSADAVVLRKIMLNLTVPCVLAGSVQTMQLDPALLVPLLFGFGVAPLAIAFCIFVTRRKDIKTQAMYMLNIASFNVASVTVPFLTAFFPAAALTVSGIFDIGNAFYGTGGVYTYTSCRMDQSRKFRVLDVIKGMRKSTPLMVYLPMLLLFVMGVRLPDGFYTLIKPFGNANSFIAFFTIGLMIDIKVNLRDLGEILRTLLMRYLFLAPLMVLVWLLPLDLLVRQVLILTLLAPFSSLAAAFCANLGCKQEQASLLNTMSIFTSMIATVAMIMLWNI